MPEGNRMSSGAEYPRVKTLRKCATPLRPRPPNRCQGLARGGSESRRRGPCAVADANDCLEGRFAQRVDLRAPRSEAVRTARGGPLVTAVFRPFWHGRGTPPGCKLAARPCSQSIDAA